MVIRSDRTPKPHMRDARLPKIGGTPLHLLSGALALGGSDGFVAQLRQDDVAPAAFDWLTARLWCSPWAPAWSPSMRETAARIAANADGVMPAPAAVHGGACFGQVTCRPEG